MSSRDSHPAQTVKNITVTFPDGSSTSVPAGTAAVESLRERFPKEARKALGVRVNGTPVDAETPLGDDCTLEILTFEDDEGRHIFRHSSAHVMAEAVQDLFPGVKFAIGPAIEDGFYYDFEPPRPFTPEDLPKIETRMKEIIRQNLPFTRETVSRREAIELFREKGERYKVELLEEMEDETVSLYRQGGFVDLCRGPHVASSGRIGAFSLLSIAGAYWRGDERNPMLQRIYGTSYPDKARLKEYLKRLEEARKRDHRKLGKELGLFSFADEVGPGLVIWHPRGALLRYLVEEFERREHLARGYHIVFGPRLLREELWKRSGHYDNYRENMYFTEVDGQRYGIKPMNCLAHIMIYKSTRRSYRDLPLRLFELGTVNRHEKSGVLHGLTRVREFTQDDAHIICTPDQLNDEIIGVLTFVKDVMGVFDFPFSLEISTRPEKSIGSDRDWDTATSALKGALDGGGFEYSINEGDGAFYGPKIDVILEDAIGRSWQCATVQCDFTMPERFDLTYTGPDGQPHRPVMIHRVVLGSIERFIAILIEHYAGAFPLWLAPEQLRVMTITSAQTEYSAAVAKVLRGGGFRVEEDVRNEKIGFKIREARLQKVPYMVIIGTKEESADALSIRGRDEGEIGEMAVPEFLDYLRGKLPDHSLLRG
jgi:threonyl-tRNA synthetase